METFDEIKLALKGTTVLAEPRVSRETILSVLKTHTDLILNLRKDHSSLANKVNGVEAETQRNRRSIGLLEEQTTRIEKDVATLFRLSDEFRREMDELSEKVTELYELKKQMADQQEFVDGLSIKFHQFSLEVSDYMTASTKNVHQLTNLCIDTQTQLKTLQEYVDHFADNLILNSQQIIVDTSCGFATRPIPLTEVLKFCNNNFEDITAVNNTQDEQLTKLFADLDTKAPDSVLFNIGTLEKKVGTIELHIKKEEEQGMGALRKQCEELTVTMQSIQSELGEKIDRDSVGLIVHEKYEEIVRYLQDALQSSLEDENNFKEKADEIQEMVILLSNSKADRTEIANMQEVMVKSEALLKKVGAQANIKDKIKDFVSRKEIEDLLSNKVDKNEFEKQLSAAITNQRKTRKLQSLNTSLPGAVDDALFDSSAGGAPPPMNSGSSSSPPVSQASNRKYMPMAGNSRPMTGSQVIPGISSNVFQIDPPIPSNQQMVTMQYQPIPVIAIGQGIGSPHRKSPDFGTYLKLKGPKGGSTKGSASTGNLPTIGDYPGAFRAATEGGKAGGTVLSKSAKEGSGAAGEGYGQSEYPYVDAAQYNGANYNQLSQMTDHLAYLNGPMVGGGFNVRSSHLLRGVPGSKAVPGEDGEGKGSMLQGNDGHLYFTDSRTGTANDIATFNPQ